ncbi:MAG TPA: RnfABCDGE type electron transport complex subunit B [Steroidobacteraceae bacterium]
MNTAAGDSAGLADSIDALLPQTQCTRCGYPGCRPYAEAIARGEVAINRCPPGGSAGIVALAHLLGREPLPLDPACGQEAAAMQAVIDAAACIGCARCLPACPVDAILGAQYHLHTVLELDCNGCELCLAACPVDCIAMQPRRQQQAPPAASDNRQRYDTHRLRLRRQSEERQQLLAERKLRAQTSS